MISIGAFQSVFELVSNALILEQVSDAFLRYLDQRLIKHLVPYGAGIAVPVRRNAAYASDSLLSSTVRCRARQIRFGECIHAACLAVAGVAGVYAMFRAPPDITGEFPMAKMSAETSVETAVHLSNVEPSVGVASTPRWRAS